MNECIEQAYAIARCPAGKVFLLLGEVGDTCNVEMDIGGFAGKMGEEFAGSDGSRLGDATVLDVGDLRFDELVVFGPEGEFSQTLVHLLADDAEEVEGVLSILLHGGNAIGADGADGGTGEGNTPSSASTVTSYW